MTCPLCTDPACQIQQRVHVISAEEALDLAGDGSVLVCFAREEDLKPIERIVVRYSKVLRFSIVRVEPTIENAQTMQIVRYPSFVLYTDGAERFQAIGADQLSGEINRIIRS